MNNKMRKVVIAVNEVLKYFRLYLVGRYESGLATSINESGRMKAARLVGCSLLEIDVAITKLKVNKEIVVNKHLVIEVKI